jgi:DNA-binding winged helix-turn-helix (wHTH) protein
MIFAHAAKAIGFIPTTMAPFRTMSATLAYRFGPFELDSGRRRLVRGRDAVWLPDRHMDVLLILLAQAGRIVSKDDLIETAWHGLAVTDNSIVQAVRGLRVTLGSQPDGEPYIETSVRKGYRFAAPVERVTHQPTRVPLEGLLDPYRAFVDGLAAVETFDRDSICRARETFAKALRVEPGFAAAHVGLANACLLLFESTRADLEPERAQLASADHHAREACRLAPSSGDAWSTLAFVRYRYGEEREAIGAARKSVALEPDNWRHHLRLAFVSWGEERLRSARHTLQLSPGLGLAHWLAATVFIARETFDAALDELREGCAAQDAQTSGAGRFPAMGLHLLRGLVLGARGEEDEALAEFARERLNGGRGHIYAREASANSWYATGALHTRRAQPDLARAAFTEALALVPGHRPASDLVRGDSKAPRPDDVDGALAAAAVLALAGGHGEAARVCSEALSRSRSSSAGWILPVEPSLHVAVRRDVWTSTLATLRSRAL